MTPAARAAESNAARRERTATLREAVSALVSAPVIYAMLLSERLARLEPIIARFWNRLGIKSPDAQLASEAGAWFDSGIYGAGTFDPFADDQWSARVRADYVPYGNLAYTSGRAYVADASGEVRPALVHAIGHVRDAQRRAEDGTQSSQDRPDVHQTAWLVLRHETLDSNGERTLKTLLPSAINRTGLESLLCALVGASGLSDNGLPVKVSVFAGVIRDGQSIWLVWNIAREAGKRRAMFATEHERAARLYQRAADGIDMRIDALLDIGAPTARDSRTLERWTARRDALVRRSLESATDAETFADAPSRSRADAPTTPAGCYWQGLAMLAKDAADSVGLAMLRLGAPLVAREQAARAARRAALADICPQDRAYTASLRNGKVRSLSDADANRAVERFVREHPTPETTDGRAARLDSHWANVRSERVRAGVVRFARELSTFARLSAPETWNAMLGAARARYADATTESAQRAESFFGHKGDTYRTYTTVVPSWPIAPATDVRAARLRRKATGRLACIRWNLATERALNLTSEAGEVLMF